MFRISCILAFWKDPDAGKERGQGEKETADHKMVGWHSPLNGQEFEQALGGGEGQGCLVSAVRGVAKSRTRLSDLAAAIMGGRCLHLELAVLYSFLVLNCCSHRI